MDAKELSAAKMRRLVESDIRRVTGMSLTEFKTALADGKIDPEEPKLAGLAMLVGARTR